MGELATVPVLADYGRGFRKCAVHQQTQRIYAIAEAHEENQALVLLDPNLRVVATAETYAGQRPVVDVAVHGDQVFVLTDADHVEGSGLRLLDLDGRFLRTIAAGQLENPQAVAASDGRAFVVDRYYEYYDEVDEEDLVQEVVTIRNVLYVIDIHSGDILQQVRVGLEEESAGAVLVDGDEIYIAGFGKREVVVLQFAGSEA